MTTRTRTDDLGPIDRAVTEKHCPRCDRWKALRHFHRDARRRDGLDPRCKNCRRAAQAASYRRHATRRRAGMAAYYAEHRGDVLAQQRAAYHADLDAAREAKRLQPRDAERRRTYQRDYQRRRRAERRCAA